MTFTQFKADVLERQPLRKNVSLGDLKIISLTTIEYQGILLGIEHEALKDLTKILGITITGLNRLESSLGEDPTRNILNAIKTGISSTKNSEVMIWVNDERSITRIKKSGSQIFSGETYFEMIERLMNKHDLDIKGMHFNPRNGNVHIHTISNSREFQVNRLPDEVFNPGISFSRTGDGIQAEPFMERLVCTNGMVTRKLEESINLSLNNEASWNEFYRELEKSESNNFVPVKFNRKVEEALITPASMSELERGIKLITTNSNVEIGDLEMFIPGTKFTFDRINRSGIQISDLSNEQKRNLRTGVTVWDVINGLTDFSSHNYGFEKKPNADRFIQVAAGDMLTRDFDTQNLILNQPF